MNEVGFVTWEMFKGYAFFVQMVFVFVAFTKEVDLKVKIPFTKLVVHLLPIKKIPTMYYSFLVAYAMLIAVNVYFNTFEWADLFVYLFTGALISLGSNGMSNANEKRKEKVGE